MSRADVVVLGGGIIGCALAYELAQRGRQVVLIERGVIGAEASSAAAGILSSQTDLKRPGPLFDLCQAARRFYPAWVKQIERASRMHTGFHVDGILYVVMTAAEEQRMAHRMVWQRRHGYRVERWSHAHVRTREPSIDQPVRCGFYFPTEPQIDNQTLMRALAVACRKAGVTVREQTTARRLIVRHQTVRGVQTSRGIVTAPVVVNCTGSWIAADGAFPFLLPVHPVRGQILVFEGPKRLFRHAVMSERAYVVQRRDGRLLVGSTVEFAGFDKALTLQGMHGILCGLRQMSCALNACKFVEAWAGLRPYTDDQLPILGTTPISGLYVATGHFRHGILLAPVTAQALTELILTGRTAVNLSPFSASRFLRASRQFS